MDSTAWHTIPTDELFEKLESSADGLDQEAAKQRVERFGANELKGEEGHGLLAHIIEQLKSPLIYLLFAAAIVSLVAGKYIDSAVIAAVVVLNTILGVAQQWRAEKALEALRGLSAPRARVLRNGSIHEVAATKVVPGDVLVLGRGDRVAADARMLSASGLMVDESSLTGESEPVAKHPGDIEKDATLADRTNMVFMSTLVTDGRGRAMVTATGMDTAIGEIAGEVHSAEREQTPLQRRLGHLSIYIGGAAILLALGVFGLGWLRGYELVEMILYSVAVAVSAIPEGLPAVISVTLALGVRRMADRNAVIRRLPAVETLGSTTVICSDKTGTITKNQMTTVRVWAGGHMYEVEGKGYSPAGDIRPLEEGEVENREDLEFLMRIGALNNDADLAEDEDTGAWQVKGTPTEGALLSAAAKVGVDYEKLQEEYPREADIPFSSKRQYMATLHEFPEDDQSLLLVKGAPERILEFCSHILVNGESVEIDEDWKARLEEINHDMAGDGLRVVAGAWRAFEPGKDGVSKEDVRQGLTLAGFWGIMDPPRESAIQAIEDAHRAGIRVIMLTGDHASTARAIAYKTGIGEEQERVITGKAVESMSDEELDKSVRESNVYARVSPQHKLRIMKALQAQGEIVAMTGDGVNDAPTLKNAGIGVAMGQTGSEVAREASDMVLTDDNFATILSAVEEGRTIFNNLRRVVFFLLTTNLGEIITLAAALVLGMPLPVTAVMILWINLITDGVCTVPLGIEPRHEDVLSAKPRPPKEGILDMRTLRRILLLAPVMAVGVLAMYKYASHNGEEYAMTIAFTTLAAFQWFQAFNARSCCRSIFSVGLFGNKWLLAGVGAALVLQLGTVYLELGRTIFGTVALSAGDWFLCVLAGSSILVVDEILKAFRVHGRSG
ncbi:hypothetical protein DPQ33_02585 [Oceanidesulfovibrio indonesiensis]|uniref:Cation-transporting P-type ATPase N-terminal domain-containing protein n=1 Tax=Oceanidesulfovibrio indonesiensis TaxID=54767 RepID=A0A7M3MIP7_9BACT|nr:HAD-IC family P-type ATPase [Oceanidesulfovibrio indonesiensis]TVM19265.1 hypothetical protein DPQ33_02585 [Oceanidesulfovibrio indonesiensis]